MNTHALLSKLETIRGALRAARRSVGDERARKHVELASTLISSLIEEAEEEADYLILEQDEPYLACRG